jgi:mRNA-degrading endonuclease RelE of RelBE toxin-antitoxin system
VTFSIYFGKSLENLPEDTRREIHRTMEQIGEVVASIPATNPWWTSMHDSLMQIDVGRWRVVYRIDRVRREIVIVEVSQIPR